MWAPAKLLLRLWLLPSSYRHGAQAAIMSPTSILAEQHYRNFTRLLAGENGILQDRADPPAGRRHP